MLQKLSSRKILFGILILGFLLRLYRFDNPIADWHSWRQADTSSVSRNFVVSGYDLLHPRFDDLSNVPSGLDNPNGYRFVEFPIYNAIQAGLFSVLGIFTLEEWGRIISMVMSLVGSFFLYQIVRKYSGEIAGLGAALFYTFLPYNIYYSRTILPDPSMVAAVIVSLYFFDSWLNKDNKPWVYGLLSLISLTTAILLKPYALFYGLPFLAIAYSKYGYGFIKQLKLWGFIIISLTPFVLWRLWMREFPEGIPSNAWLLNGNGIRFRPSFFRWIGYERVIKLISGYVGIIVVLCGFYQLKYEKTKLLYSSIFLSAAAYLLVFATGNVQHDYYQIVIMPAVALVYGLGTKFFLKDNGNKFITLKSVLFVGISLGAFLLSWFQVRDYFNVNNRAIVIAGEAVDKTIPKDAKVIANYVGDTSFLYQTKRKGWASFEKPLPEMIKLGAHYLVLVNPNDADRELGTAYKIIKATKEYIIFDLTQKP